MFNPNSEVWTHVLDPSAFVAAKRARLSCNYSVQLCWLWNIGIFEDEDDDEHEEKSSISGKPQIDYTDSTDDCR